MPETAYIQLLRDKLIQRLADDWETNWKDKGHGNEFINFGLVKNKNSLYNELRADIYRAIEARYGTDEARVRFVSPDSIRRLLDERYQGGFTEKVKDAVSIYLGDDSWEDFKSKCLPHEDKESEPDRSDRIPKSLFMLLPLMAVIVGIWAIYFWHRAEPAKITFRIIRVDGQSAPVTLQVQYEISDTTYKHALVQVRGQTGMLIEEVPLHEYAGILPITMLHSGVRSIQLLIDGKVIREIPYMVKTNGWLGRTVDHGQSYPAVMGRQLRQQGALYISPPIALQPNANRDYVTFYSNCRNFGIQGDKAIIDFRARNTPTDGGLSCCDIGLEMQDAKKGQVALNFVVPGCMGFASLKINNNIRDARNDYSLAMALGQDVRQWATYRIRIANRRIQAFRDNRLLFQRPCPVYIDTLTHLLFTFKGTGRLDWIRMTDAHTGQIAYQEDF